MDTVLVTLEAVSVTEDTSTRISFTEARSTVAMSIAVLVLSSRGLSSLTAGSSSFTRPSVFCSIG